MASPTQAPARLSPAVIDRLTLAAAADPAVFLGLYGRVLDPILGDQPFALWPHLATLLDAWREHRLGIVLKSRQLGVSWLLAGYALWTAKFQLGANVLIVSKSQRDAALVLAKVKYLEARLPAFLRWPRGKDNESTLEFPLRDSRINALPSTKDAGRGEGATLVLMDEFAFHEYGSLNYAAIKPTIDAGGRMVVVSTANGLGGPFADLWTDARLDAGPVDTGTGIWQQQGPGPNGFVPVFLDWSCRPGRDAAWLERQRAEYSPLLLKQEYPANPTEAFIVSGRPVFDADALEAVFDTDAAPLERSAAHWLTVPGLTAYEPPNPKRTYLIGVDVAQGLAHGDASCAVVLDAETHAEVAHLHSQDQPDIFAAKLDDLATLYPCRLGVERAGPGFQVLYKLRELQTASTPYAIYFDTSVLKTPAGRLGGQTVQTQEPGWVTSGGTKPTMIGELEAATRLGQVTIRSRQAYEQMRAYQRSDNGETGGSGGKHDDCVMAWAIAWQMRKWPLIRERATSYQVDWGNA